MITVLIAEDELLVRMGILSMVNWEELGFSISACVSDGTAALAAARRQSPDIIITDIVMPGMDGMELLRAVRADGLRCPAIVITALHQREAAESAQSLGIVACLVKATMTQQEILAALHLAKAALPADAHASEAVLAAPNRTESTFAAYLAGIPSKEVLHSMPHFLVLMEARGNDIASSTLGRTLARLTSDAVASYGVLCTASHADQLLLALDTPAAGQPPEELMRALTELRQYAQRNLLITPNFIVCRAVSVQAEMFPQVQHMQSMLAAADGIRFVSESQTPPDLAELQRFVRACGVRLWTLLQPVRIYAADRLLRAIAQGTDATLPALLARLMEIIGAPMPATEVRECMENCQSALIARAATICRSDEVGTAVLLVLENLDREVKLSEAACVAGFHEVYFSALFKRRMGMGFSRFCGMLRMEHAKELLHEGGKSISETTHLCGYHDIAYFSRVFKQIVGTTPAAWKETP